MTILARVRAGVELAALVLIGAAFPIVEFVIAPRRRRTVTGGE